MPSFVTTCPRYSTSDRKNVHFPGESLRFVKQLEGGHSVLLECFQKLRRHPIFFPQDCVHKRLERSWCRTKSERHT